MPRDKVYGGQSQVFYGLAKDIERSQPPVWLCIDPDSAIFADIKSASPNTVTLARIYTGQPEVDDWVRHPDAHLYGRRHAETVYARIKDPAHTDYVLTENEPNDHYADLTRFIQRLNLYLIGFAERAKELGFKPIGPNFSTGYPEVFAPQALGFRALANGSVRHNREEVVRLLQLGTRAFLSHPMDTNPLLRVLAEAQGYQIWNNAWLGLADGLRAIKSAGGALGLHEYDAPDLFRLWSDSAGLGYLVGRHKAAYRALPDDLQDLPLYLTELGIDWLVHGVQGGFWHDRDPETAMAWYVSQLREAWTRVYKTTPQLQGACVFIHGNNSPWFWEEYDTTRTDTSRRQFVDFLAEHLDPADPPPPPPPTGTDMIRPDQIRAKLPGTIAKGLEWNLGRHVYGEWYPIDDDGQLYAANLFEKGGVLAWEKNGVWQFKFFKNATYELSDQPVVDTTPTGYVFPQVLTDIGAVGEQGVRVDGQPFYRLKGASVRRGISAFMVVTVFSGGVPKIGAKVVNLFPDGNGEVIETDGSGNARFQFGASSAFTTPGTGPFTIFVADDSAFKDSDSVPKRVVFQHRLSDIVKSLGDFQGTHTEISVQFVEEP